MQPHPIEPIDQSQPRAGRGRLRKWVGRLLWIFPAILALYVCLKIADAIWYHTQIPAAFADAKWFGSWSTERYGGFTGDLIVRLPDPLPENQDFKAEALVYYPIYSGWQTGRFVRMDFDGRFTPDSPTSAGRTTNRIPGGNLKFKGKAGNQIVEYSALIDETHTLIIGGYISNDPDDEGYFSIVKRR